MRKRAREETMSMRTLYNGEVATEDQPQLLPSFPSMSSALYRHRRKKNPALPQTRAEVQLEGNWTETTDIRPFLLFTDCDANKIVVFSTHDQLQALQSADTVYMDGTFTSCPDLWNQVYIIYARSRSCMCPLVFALLPDRQTTTYTRLFSRLKTEVLSSLPFEVEVGRYSRPKTPLHLRLCDLAEDTGSWISSTVQGRSWIRRAAGLALLPLRDVQDTWLDAKQATPPVLRTEDFNDYMVITIWSSIDDDARFPIPLLNHHQTAGPRTNNNLEGFHHGLNRTLPHRHPNIYRFVEVIKKIECADRTKTVRLWCRPTQQEASLQRD
ncbi:uncharacterized protein LOC125381425 [Haliotis rufescens]|uniref:uncharacterized protein LOC125381425 n=1 Tax=Haliotis rufescens TaxID=6454 RepID=UPI00201EF18B|nr:uncharacterized protein LOC125381425 [Haliotis rufescens]